MSEAHWRPSCTRQILCRRAALVERMREFFRSRDVLEVDTPVLQSGANLDHGVVPFVLETTQGRRFLPTSPEHPLKRLVTAGFGAVWTLAPAFRADERGQRHAPEFRMLEWYRPDWNDYRIAEETVALCCALTGLAATTESLTWREAFRRHAGLDPARVDDATLVATLGEDAQAVISDGRLDRSAALDLLLTQRVEPHLGQGCWTLLTDYPAQACAQARLRTGEDGEPVAARFELYRNGVELANGYWELNDAVELELRLRHELRERQAGEILDGYFLAAMSEGLPDCAGVAVGFDRLVMLALGLDDIADTQAFSWARA